MVDSTPTLMYDGECGFCRYWVGRWIDRVGHKVEFVPSQDLGEGFPSIPKEEFARAVQFVDAGGQVYSGAEAVFRMFSHGRGGGRLLGLYERMPGFAPASERAYRLFADHRRFWSGVNWALWGRDYEPARFFLGRWLFLRNLGLIFLVAFISFNGQLEGLVGENGIAPAAAMLDRASDQLGIERFWRMPTLLWLNASDGFMHLLCFGGIVAAVLLSAGVLAPAATFAAWLLYLSIVWGGQAFMSFQWDILLLETAFIAMFLAPLQLTPRSEREYAPSRPILWLHWFLLFRLMFSSGMAKLDDTTWLDLKALTYHYETQPLPNVLGWYAHHLPLWIHELSVRGMFVIELAVPFMFFLQRRLRHLGGCTIIFFMVLIIATGNYTFFNWLTIALCLLLFDDQSFKAFLPRGLVALAGPPERAKPRPRVHTVAAMGVAVFILALGATSMVGRFMPGNTPPAAAVDLLRATQPFFLVNRYGLFAHMTLSRPEIVVEGSNDNETWTPYAFKWKAGDLEQRPRQVAPFQPRLDWQMWFAALGSPRSAPWFPGFIARLLEGKQEVLDLLAENPFPDGPPIYVRATLYDYRFTGLDVKRDTGHWWRREYLRPYFGPVLLRANEAGPAS